eukprot:TRINITY_DN25115_c0_g1_i1.p1 TRINITY_DN25115_c0_g1~~TRINITY_DN25115_c0_g1_i1.p1  ORF type:complete len:479 (-),score=90.59 TRINITY_DN25115_c0_g1_i1:30-1439(-)
MGEFTNLKTKFDSLVARDADIEKGYNEILHPCLNGVINEMKNTDSTFCHLYQDIHFSGSYYDKLAVGNLRHEFDLNVIYKVPEEGFEIRNADKKHAQFMEFSTSDRNAEKFQAIVEDDKISSEKMKSVMKSAADRALTNLGNKITLDNGVEVNVTRTDSLPYTLVLKPTSGRFQNKVEVDLVPAFRVSTSKLPDDVHNHLTSVQNKVGSSVDQFLAIAIPIVHKDKLEVDFPQTSREILKGKASAKMAIRLLKQERNEKGGPMEKIWSHAIKTAALHEVLKNPDQQHWHEAKLPFRLTDIRNSMQKYLSNEKMTDVYFPTVNMMERIKSTNVKAGVAKYLERSSKNIPMNGKDFACGTSQCNKMFKTTGGATQHAKNKHGSEDGQTKTRAEKDTPCSLEICNKLLRGKRGSVCHSVDSHREEADKQDIWRKFLIEEGKIPCGFCSCGGGKVRGFASMQGYNDHARAMNH